MKALITWKGGGEGDETEYITWHGVKYERGKAYESENPDIIAKAKDNQYFDVVVTEEDTGEKPKPLITPAPSTMSAQHPVPKPGEPLEVTERGGARVEAMAKPPGPPGKPSEPGSGPPAHAGKPPEATQLPTKPEVTPHKK